MTNKPKVYVLSGPPGSGKSTIGELLAKKVPNSAIVSTDTIRHLIKNGKAGVGDLDWIKQLHLGAKNSCILANNFLKEGFNVFLDDVVCEEIVMKIYFETLKDPTFITLLPSREVVAKRDLERGGEMIMGERAMYLYDKIKEFLDSEKRFVVFDTSNETPEESVERIIKHFNGLS